MKRLLTTILIICFLIMLFSSNVFAASTISCASEVVLEKAQTSFEININVDNFKSYAGAEFALQCADGVTVESVSYSKSISKAGPTQARGFTWFSYFSGSNDYEGNVTATVILKYSGNENTSIVIDNVSIYTAQTNHTIQTEKQELRKTIIIRRKGSDNEVSSLTPPSSSSPSTSNASGSTSSNKSTGNTASTNHNSGSNNQVDSSQSGQNSSLTSSVSESVAQTQSDIESETQTNIQKDRSPKTNYILVILLIISLVGNVLLGYFLINRKTKIN